MQQYATTTITKEQQDVTQQATITASQAQRGFGKMLKRVYVAHEHLIIERDGLPVAVMMSYQEYEQFRSYLAQRKLIALGKKVGVEVDEQGLTEEQLIEDIRETRKEVYQERYGRVPDKE